MTRSRAPFFLLEIGCEELPDRMIVPALRYLGRELQALAERERLGRPVLEPSLLGTPRRLALRARGLLPRQEDREIQVVGPRVDAAYDARGKPTRALEGFARAQGVAPERLVRVATAKGECVAAIRQEAGREAKEVLASALPSIIAGIPFGKTMRWGDGSFRFARPLQWIVCLMGNEIVPFQVAGISSGAETRGARFAGSPRVLVPDAHDYPDLLEKASVLVNVEARRSRIASALTEECSRLGTGFHLEELPHLLDTVNGMVEFPVAAAGSFDREFLALPAPILSTAMIHHQRFFPVRSSAGQLAAHYVAVLNCTPSPAVVETVRRGNEWVLRARLRDADFFWREDRKRTLEERLPDLERILFEAELGSYRQKVERVESLTRELCRELRRRGQELDADAAAAAARLSKSDLTTLMVKEFPELQGVVGALYAREEKRPEPICAALEQQYRGAGEGDDRERFVTREGAVLAVADRLDTLAGFFLLGRIATGSRDPYGLRRAALALVQATLDQALSYALAPLLEHARGLYAAQGVSGGAEAALTSVVPFLEERLRHVCQEKRGFRYDAVNAALAVGCPDLLDAFRRAEALNALRGHPDFEALSLSFRRVRNILAGQNPGPLEESALDSEEERILLRALLGVEGRAAPLLSSGDYAGALRAMASLRPSLDRFFEKVLVMDPDPCRRTHRLALLRRVADLFLKVGDLAEMVLEGETAEDSARRVKRG